MHVTNVDNVHARYDTSLVMYVNNANVYINIIAYTARLPKVTRAVEDIAFLNCA